MALAGLVTQQALLFNVPVKIAGRDRPCISLVLNKPMNDGDGTASIAFDQFDTPQQMRCVGETGDVSVRNRPISISGLIPASILR